MEVRRALVVGVGQASIPALHKLRNQLAIRHEDIPVIGTILIHNTPDLETQALHPDIQIIPVTANEQQQIKTTLREADVVKQIDQTINDILLQEKVLQLARKDIQVATSTPVELIIVGNLEEEFTATAVLATASVIYPRIDYQEQTSGIQRAIAILTLPTVGSSTSLDIQSRASRALRELNDYLAKARSGLQAIVAEESRAIQQVYLLEATNSANMRISRPETLLWMVGDWLYYYLTSNLVPTFEEAGNIEAFSSLGYASLFVPEPQMRAVLTDWFIQEAFNDYLLAAPGPEPDPNAERLPDSQQIDEYWQKVAQQDQQARGLLADQLKNDIVAVKQRPALIEVRYANKVFYRYEELERQLAADYAQQLQKVLPQTVENQRKNVTRILRQAMDQFDLLQKNYLDTWSQEHTYAPIRTAIRLFDLFTQEMERRLYEQRIEVQRQEQIIQEYDETIRQDRAAYWDAARIFGVPSAWLPVPYILPVWGFLTALAVTTYIGLIITNILQQPLLGIGFIAITVILGLIFFISALLRAKQYQNSLIRDYTERLNAIVAQNDARQLRGFYEALIHMLKEEYTDRLKRIKNRLNDQLDRPIDERRSPYTRTGDRDRTIDPDVEKQMYGTPQYELELSLVERSDIDAWYRELFAEVDKELQAFFQIKALSQRLRDDLDTFRADLQIWLQQTKLKRLQTEPIRRYFQKYSDERRREMLPLMIKQAHAYVRVVQTDLNVHREGEKHHVRLGQQDEEFVKPLLDGIDRTMLRPELKLTQDSLRIDTLSALTRIPLNSVGLMKQLPVIDSSDTGQPGFVTTEVVLNDPLTETELTVYSLVALARAFAVLWKEGNQWGYNKIDSVKQLLQESNPYTFEPLGETYMTIVNELRNPGRSGDQKAIYDALTQRLEAEIHQDQSGSQLGQQIQQWKLQPDIEAVERDTLEDYLRKFAQKMQARNNANQPPVTSP